jgi:hypothetical protein
MQPLSTTRLIALLAYAAVAVASAQQRNSEGYAKTLEGPERVARMQVPRVVEALALKPGDRMGPTWDPGWGCSRVRLHARSERQAWRMPSTSTRGC